MESLLPPVSVNVMRGATSALGTVLINLVIFHATHFPKERRREAVMRAMKVAQEAAKLAPLQGATPEEQKAMTAFLDMLFAQVENGSLANLRKGERDGDGPKGLN